MTVLREAKRFRLHSFRAYVAEPMPWVSEGKNAGELGNVSSRRLSVLLSTWEVRSPALATSRHLDHMLHCSDWLNWAAALLASSLP